MADDEINPLGTPTTNYGWIKPTVGGDDDAWGGLLNTDLDGIDSTVKSVSTVANAAYPASNPAGYITASAIPAPYVLPTASTTILGGVKVDGSTVTAAGDGTLTSHASGGIPEAPTDGKLYSRQNSAWTPTVVPMGDNRIINGDMRIDQRNAGASGTTNAAYTVDRWRYSGSQVTKGAWQRYSGPSLIPIGFGGALSFTSSSAYALLAGDSFTFYQPIEADMVSDLAWGTANAQTVTLSFWVLSSLTGTFGGSIRNDTLNRSYPFAFSIPAASTWTKIVVTIPGDTAGTWVMSGNGAALLVGFSLGSGTNFTAAAGAWTAGSISAPTGAVSVVSTNGATFFLTGVKLEIGSIATPFNRKSMAESMVDCQRYYQVSQIYQGASGQTAGGAFNAGTSIPVAMRATPTLASTLNASSNWNLGGLSAGASFVAGGTSIAAGQTVINVTFSASAEL